MTPIDLDAAYNNRAMVPGHPAIMAGWAGDAAAYRAARSQLLAEYAEGSADPS